MDSTEEQGQQQHSLQQHQQQNHHHRVSDSGSNRENELEPIDLDHLDTIMPASDRQTEGHPFGPETETSAEVDKRAAQELFDGTLADISDTNTPVIDAPDAATPTPANNSDAENQADSRVEENSIDQNAQEDLDYNEDDSDTNRHGGDETAVNRTSPTPEQPVSREEEGGGGEGKDQTDQPSTESNLDQDKQQFNEEKDEAGEEDKIDEPIEDFPAQKRGRRKRETDYEFDEVEYIIERIVSKEIDDNGKAKFLVKWENYPSTSNTWEPLENLVGCEKALQKFEQEKAKKLAKKCANGQTSSLLGKGKNLIDQKYRLKEIIGMTVVEEVKYFVITLTDPKESPKFIRASLANRMFPDRVIDFYETKIRWDRD